MNYEEYLLRNGYGPSTIRPHILRVERFKNWSGQQGTIEDCLAYTDLLRYAKYLQSEKIYGRQSTNNELRAIKLYYDYLIDLGEVMENPAEDLSIRGIRTKIIGNLLDMEELENLYYSYETHHHDTFFRTTKQRDKIVMGLMIFQGATPMELYRLEEEHLHLHKGKIDIPGTRRSDPRTLKLHTAQIMGLIEYMETVRPYLAKRGTVQDPEKLLLGNIDQMHRITGRVVRTLKKYNQKVTGRSQLRASTITSWLTIHNLRKVQYMAGHRYISSTERYLQDDMGNLHDIVDNLHPIN